MRFGGFGGRFALLGALWAVAAGAEPVIVDPDPAPDVDWELRLQPVVSGLASPSALVFFGLLENEEFLVLEKDTGRVRHFKQRDDQGDALDLAVDNCGERGLVGIALHPDFDPTPTPVTEPPTVRPPSQDWVYLSYHTDAGRTADGCDLDAVHRVERYVWNGTLLVPDPLVAPDPDTTDEFEPFVPFERSVETTTAVGGSLATSIDQSLDFASLPVRLYVAIGSLERDGKLQNNRLAAGELDDTSVILRLDQNGKTPGDNPFDHDLDGIDAEDRYFAYGLRDPRGLAVDPFSDPRDRQLWFTEWSDGGLDAMPDEINRGSAGANGGYRSLQGRVTALLPNTDPNYALVDLEQTAATPPVPVSTYRNPAFSFEDKAITPTGIAFGGREAGPLHLGALFVGGGDGRLFRYAVDAPRIGFVLGDPLVDTVAAAGDDLTQIVVGEGFGAISDVETGLDGSLYVLGGASGAIHRVFRDARRDLAVTRVKVPTRISLSAARPTRSKRIRLTLENRGEVIEHIVGRDEPALRSQLEALLGLQISGLPPANCTAPTWALTIPSFALPPYAAAIGIKPKGKLKLSIDVVWECASPTPKGSFDFETRFDLNGAVIGMVDENPDNDVCPRPPSGADKGCGKKGAPLQTDVVRK